MTVESWQRMFIRETFELARQAALNGDHPFGALLVKDGEVALTDVTYGCSAEMLGQIAGGSFVIPCREIFARGQRPVTVTGPILEVEGAAIHERFWPAQL